MISFLTFLTDIIVPLAWPIVATLCILIFKSDIKGGLKRIAKAGPTGIEMFPHVKAQKAETPEAVSDQTFNKLDKEDKGLSPWLNQIEEQLQQNPNDNNLDAIKRIAAIYSRRAYSENIFRLIFGSQLEALERMVSGPQSLEDLRDLYNDHMAQAGKHSSRNANEWMMFLLKANLVGMVNGKYELTDFGSSFYDMLIKSGFSVKSKVW